MDFKTLKANSGKNLSKLTDELNKVSGAATKGTMARGPMA